MIRRTAVNAALGAALVAALGLNWYARQPSLQPNFDVPQMMARDAAYGAFDPNPHFAGRATHQAPVANTIARGQPPIAYGPSVMEGIRAGKELENPFAPGEPAAVERGRLVYARYCELCHAADGKGNGPLSKHGFPAPTLHREFARRMPDGQMFHLVTFGRGAMPSHAGQIAVDDRWKVVLYVRSLQRHELAAASPPAGGE